MINYLANFMVDTSDGTVYDVAGIIALAASSGATEWGGLTGTLSDQTDLNSALAGKQPLDAELTALAGLTSAANAAPYFTGSGAAALMTVTTAGRALLDDADAAAMRATLGLVIGTDVQAFDSDLSALAALSGTNTIYYRSAANTWTAVTIGSGLTFSAGTLDAAGGAATWGAIVGTLASQTDLTSALAGKQPLDAELTALAGLTSAADTAPYFTGSGTAALTTVTTAGRALLDDADAAAMRSTLGVQVSGFECQLGGAIADATYTMVTYATFAFRILGIYGLKHTSGTSTLTVKINTTAVTGLSSLSVTSTPQNATASAAYDVAVGDAINFTVASGSSPIDLLSTLKIERL